MKTFFRIILLIILLFIGSSMYKNFQKTGRIEVPFLWGHAVAPQEQTK